MIQAPDLSAARRELFRPDKGGFHAFVRAAWNHADPQRYVDSPHIQAVCEHLQAVSLGEIRDLMINIPPSCSKTKITTVLWPVWDWLYVHAQRHYMFVSYDLSLMNDSSQRTFNFAGTDWFRQHFGTLIDPTQSLREHRTVRGGYRYNTSIRGKSTGRHVDRMVIDDPIKPADALNPKVQLSAALEDVITWWQGTAPTRVRDPKTHSRVIIMQRLAERDLCGHVLQHERDGFVHLCLPMRFEASRKCMIESTGFEDWRSTEGELLCPQRFDEIEVSKLESKLGPANAPAQLQQRPRPRGGKRFRASMFRYFHPLGEAQLDPFDRPCLEVPKPSEGFFAQSWDCTFKDTADADFVAGGVWQIIGSMFYLRDQFHDRAGFVRTCEVIEQMISKWPRSRKVYIEDKANGSAVIDTLKKKFPGLEPVEPEGGKVARATAAEAPIAAGCVVLPHPDLADWVGYVDEDGEPLDFSSFVGEFVTFPRGVHDDQVDQTTQLLLRHYRRGSFEAAMQKVKQRGGNIFGDR